MTRVHIGSWCTLIHADSHAVIEELRAMKPDAVVMDPPYGLRLNGTAGVRRSRTVFAPDYVPSRTLERRGGPTPVIGDVDGNVDIRPFVQLAGVTVTWGADHLRSQLPDGGRFIAWDKLDGKSEYDSFSDVEFAWCSAKGKATIVRYLWKGLMSVKKGEDNGFRIHPMQKPVGVMQKSIRACKLDPGSLVCDPFMGAGTTAVAAFGLGMRFVGVEIERRWFDAAVERIRERCAAELFETS